MATSEPSWPRPGNTLRFKIRNAPEVVTADQKIPGATSWRSSLAFSSGCERDS